MDIASDARPASIGLMLAALAACNAYDGSVAALQPPSAFAEAERSDVSASELFPDGLGSADDPTDAPADGQTALIAPTGSSGDGGVRFTPVVGAPLEAVRPLSAELRTTARERGLTIKNYEDETSDHILKGYLSAETVEGTTLVIYVWDVLDGAGNRLHRIRGVEELEQRRNAEAGWPGVPESVMQMIGEKTIAEYFAWRERQAG